MELLLLALQIIGAMTMLIVAKLVFAMALHFLGEASLGYNVAWFFGLLITAFCIAALSVWMLIDAGIGIYHLL